MAADPPLALDTMTAEFARGDDGEAALAGSQGSRRRLSAIAVTVGHVVMVVGLAELLCGVQGGTVIDLFRRPLIDWAHCSMPCTWMGVRCGGTQWARRKFDVDVGTGRGSLR